jgi:hypothetical protein
MADRDCAIPLIQAHLGYKSGNSTMQYTKKTTEQATAALKRAEGLSEERSSFAGSEVQTLGNLSTVETLETALAATQEGTGFEGPEKAQVVQEGRRTEKTLPIWRKSLESQG